MGMKTVSFSLTPELESLVQARALETKRSASDIVREALLYYFKEGSNLNYETVQDLTTKTNTIYLQLQDVNQRLQLINTKLDALLTKNDAQVILSEILRQNYLNQGVTTQPLWERLFSRRKPTNN